MIILTTTTTTKTMMITMMIHYLELLTTTVTTPQHQVNNGDVDNHNDIIIFSQNRANWFVKPINSLHISEIMGVLVIHIAFKLYLKQTSYPRLMFVHLYRPQYFNYIFLFLFFPSLFRTPVVYTPRPISCFFVIPPSLLRFSSSVQTNQIKQEMHPCVVLDSSTLCRVVLNRSTSCGDQHQHPRVVINISPSCGVQQ